MKKHYTILLTILLLICISLFFSLKKNDPVQDISYQKNEKEKTQIPSHLDKPVQKPTESQKPLPVPDTDSLKKAKIRKAYANFLANHPYKKTSKYDLFRTESNPQSFPS